MYDCIVVGAGFWGVACAWLARQRGANVLLLDAGDPLSASPAATCWIAPQWYHRSSEVVHRMLPERWDSTDVDGSIRWLQDYCGMLTVPQQAFFVWKDKRSTPRETYLLPEASNVLDLVTATNARVLSLVHKPDYWELYTTRNVYTSRTVVVAAGVWTDALLMASALPPVGVRALLGRAELVAAENIAVEGIIEVFFGPRLSFNVRSYQGHFRVGDTTERHPSVRLYQRMQEAGRLVLGRTELISRIEGLRPVASHIIVERWAPGLVVATGGHRVGIGLSHLVAKDALEQLGI